MIKIRPTFIIKRDTSSCKLSKTRCINQRLEEISMDGRHLNSKNLRDAVYDLNGIMDKHQIVGLGPGIQLKKVNSSSRRILNNIV